MATNKWISLENIVLSASVVLSIVVVIFSSIFLNDLIHPTKCSLDLSMGNLQQDQKFSLGAISVFVSAAEYTILTQQGLALRPTGKCFSYCQQNKDLNWCRTFTGGTVDFSECLDSCIICRDKKSTTIQNCITGNCTLFGF